MAPCPVSTVANVTASPWPTPCVVPVPSSVVVLELIDDETKVKSELPISETITLPKEPVPLPLIEPSTVNSVVSGVVDGIPIPTKPPSVLPDTLTTALV